MKNRKNLFVTLLATVTLLFVGCSNGLNNFGTVKGGNAVRDVCIELTNFASSSSSARTIAPDAISKGDTASYIFIADGKNSRNSSIGPVICNVSSGKINLSSLEAGVWTITITMYEKTLLEAKGVDLTDVTDATATAIVDNKATCAVLSGNAVVDLTKSNATTSVTLTPDGIGTNGKVNLTLNFNEEDLNKPASRGLKYVAGLYNKINGEKINATEEAGLANGTYSVDSVKKGLYTFKVTITAIDGTGPWYYSDDIYIEGNRTTKETITLPKIIGEAPTAPEALTATLDTENAELGRYTANFTWTRESYNESGFELQIVELQIDDLDEIPDSPDSIKESFSDESNIFTVENFASTEYPIYAKDGTLLAGSEGINYYLETGKIYVARIRAVNYNGKSDWKYISSIINCYTVTYDFAGYKLIKESETLTPSIVEFVSYNATTPYTPKYVDYDLYKTNDEPTEENAIRWSGWKNRIAGTKVESYTGFENIVLTPNIENYLDFEIESAGTYKDLLEGNLNLYVGTATDKTPATTTTIEYNASTANTLYVAIEDFTDDDPIPATVTKVDYTLKGVDGSAFYATSSAPKTFEATFDLSKISAGDYTLYAEAKLTSGYIVTTQIQLVIK